MEYAAIALSPVVVIAIVWKFLTRDKTDVSKMSLDELQQECFWQAADENYNTKYNKELQRRLEEAKLEGVQQ